MIDQHALAAELRAGTPQQRVRHLWQMGTELHGLIPDDILATALLKAAADSGLITALNALNNGAGKHGREDCEHVIAWAIAGRDPFDRRVPA